MRFWVLLTAIVIQFISPLFASDSTWPRVFGEMGLLVYPVDLSAKPGDKNIDSRFFDWWTLNNKGRAIEINTICEFMTETKESWNPFTFFYLLELYLHQNHSIKPSMAETTFMHNFFLGSEEPDFPTVVLILSALKIHGFALVGNLSVEELDQIQKKTDSFILPLLEKNFSDHVDPVYSYNAKGDLEKKDDESLRNLASSLISKLIDAKKQIASYPLEFPQLGCGSSLAAVN